jgi:hypothetical protein
MSPRSIDHHRPDCPCDACAGRRGKQRTRLLITLPPVVVRAARGAAAAAKLPLTRYIERVLTVAMHLPDYDRCPLCGAPCGADMHCEHYDPEDGTWDASPASLKNRR